MKMVWRSADDSIRSLSAMDDEHLANALLHMRHYGRSFSIEQYNLVLNEAVNVRGLSITFLRGAPYPYKNKRTGKWMIWSFEANCDVQISGLRV